MTTSITTRGTGYLVLTADRLGTQLNASSGRALHAVGCVVDGGHLHHRRRGFRCNACAQTTDTTVERLLTALDTRKD